MKRKAIVSFSFLLLTIFIIQVSAVMISPTQGAIVEASPSEEVFIDSPNTQEMCRRYAEELDFVAQIFIGDIHIRGWRGLEPMIESGEIDRILGPV